MSAGLNVAFDVWRILEDSDDVVGGAMITGSVVYYSVPGRFQKLNASQVYLEQGLETERIFTCHLVPGTLDIKERDELQLVQPTDHPMYGQRFRVVDFSPSDHNRRDPRSYINIQMTRSVRAHRQQ